MTSLYNFTQDDLKKLLANRFIVLIGDSVMRTIYKDLIVMLQYGRQLTIGECRTKGDAHFHNDVLIEGGRMTNGKDYREVRQYVSPQHLIRFYFITRVYSGYVETIFADFYKSLKPDIVIVNSCLWDISRYGVKSMESYKVNLQKFCCNLKRLLSSQAAVIWTTTLPVSSQIRGGFLSQGTGFLSEILRLDVLVANNFSFQVAKRFGFGVLDMHFLFRHKLHLMAADGVHWMNDAHRDITNVLMGYICRALNVVVPKRCRTDKLLHYQQPSYNDSLMSFEEPKSVCRADDETEMSYCEGLYNEVPYDDGNPCADNNLAVDSFHEDSLVEWPKRSDLSPDRNTDWLKRNIGKWQRGPEGSSTPNLSHNRIRSIVQRPTECSSQSLNKFSRNANPNSESKNKWADDSYIILDESLDDNEPLPKIDTRKGNASVGNRVMQSENQHVSIRPLSNSHSSFKENWKPYQSNESWQTQKSSMQNVNRGKRSFAHGSYNLGNNRHENRFHQPYYGHNSLQNQGVYQALSHLVPQLQWIANASQHFDHAFQRSIYNHRLHPY